MSVWLLFVQPREAVAQLVKEPSKILKLLNKPNAVVRDSYRSLEKTSAVKFHRSL